MTNKSGMYKDSGTAWIGNVPSDWEIRKGKVVFEQSKTKGNDVPILLAATQKYGMIPQSQLEGVVQVGENADMQSFKTVHKNDYVISLRSFQGGFEMSDYEGVCSPAYTVFRSRNRINHKYYKYLFKVKPFIEKINSFYQGIREGKQIHFEEFAKMDIPVPSLSEQSSIATFLDEKCSEIDSLVSLQVEMMEELQAYKQSVITEAVTKGLNPKVPMKDTGIEWIGKIPAHWKLPRLKNAYSLHGRIGWNGLRSDEFRENSFAYLVTGQDFKSAEVDWSKCYQIEKERYEEDPFIQLRNGDILVTKDGTVGKIAKVSNLDKPACLNSGIFVMRAYNDIHEQGYLYWLLVSPLLVKFNNYANLGGTTIIHLYQNVFERMPLVVPPMNEQIEISKYLDSKVSQIDSLINLKNEKIEELNEYKKCLIYEYVTGKKRV